MIIEYDKLVRDKIPEIIQNSGKEFKTNIADKQTAIHYLIKKFDEELTEFKEAYSKEELADVLELIHGLAYQLDYDMNEIEAIRERKFEKRGGFKNRIILEHVVE